MLNFHIHVYGTKISIANSPIDACSLAQDIVAVATFLAVFIPEESSSLIINIDKRLNSAVTSILGLPGSSCRKTEKLHHKYALITQPFFVDFKHCNEHLRM